MLSWPMYLHSSFRNNRPCVLFTFMSLLFRPILSSFCTNDINFALYHCGSFDARLFHICTDQLISTLPFSLALNQSPLLACSYRHQHLQLHSLFDNVPESLRLNL